MTWLQKVREEGADTSGRTNIVIVPGNNGETLAEQTCSHFPTWLDHVSVSENKSTVVWIFRHDIKIDNLASWFAYCEAGEHLLQNLASMQKEDGLSDNDSLILIGHKLGSFMLKKALVDANRNSHHPHMDALLNTIETLVMLGDPDLHPDNMNEWISLISKCLPCRTLPKHLNCAQDAKCLQYVADCFEQFTIHSTLFQVSGAAESKRKHLLKFRAEDPRCICSATMTVRMWTTTDDEVILPPGQGDTKNCAFYPKSTLYNQLLSIPNYVARSSISSSSGPSAVLELEPRDGPSKCFPVIEPGIDLICSGPASSAMTSLTMVRMPSTDAVPITTEELASDISASSIEIKDETNHAGHSDEHLDPRTTTPDCLAAEVNNEPEKVSCCDLGSRSSETTSHEEAKEEGSFSNAAQQHHPSDPFVRQTPRVSRRLPFLFMQVPSRDAKFFGREELLLSLQDILMPVSVPCSGDVATLDSGAVIVLHGPGGVGKSAIALELTYRTQAMFDHVFWLRANSNLHLAQSFHQAAVSLGLVQGRGDHNHESSRQKFIAWLSTTSSQVLLVFDDADELQITLRFMPQWRRGSIIVTSRQPLPAGLDIEQDENLHTVKVKPFVVEDATGFIQSLARCAVDPTNPVLGVASLTKIAERCGCLPLNLRGVGTILNRYGSIKNNQIMATLEQHASCVLDSQPSDSLISDNLSSASMALANVISFLDPYCVDDSILLGAQRYRNVSLSAFPMRDDDYFEAKNELITYALLDAGADPYAVNMHRVTARSLRNHLDPDDFRESFQSACQLLEARWPSRRKMKNIVLGNWPEFDALHCHVHQVSSICREYDRQRRKGYVIQDLVNDTYMNLLFQSTWYNALLGNAEEDQAMILLAHGIIERSQRPDLSLPQSKDPSITLPARLIDVGLDNTQLPRLVDTAGKTGCFVALSHCRSSRSSSETQLTISNMSRLQQSIEHSEISRCVFDAIKFTRSLGVRYLWVDSLCILQGDQEALSRMSDIYRSAIVTIVAWRIKHKTTDTIDAVDTSDETIDSCIDSPVLEQPFSIFLDWSRPMVAKSFSNRLSAPNAFSRAWTLQERLSSFNYSMSQLLTQLSTLLARDKNGADDIALATPTNGSDTPRGVSSNSDHLHDSEVVETELEDSRTHLDQASREIDRGVYHVEAGKILDALASFMKARELVSAFQTLNSMSWQIHAVASSNIALVYQLQNLPATALEIAEASLALQSRTSDVNCTSTLARVRLNFVIGGIHNALGNLDEKFKYYKIASQYLETMPGEERLLESADWKGVLDLKLAEHQLKLKDYKGAHALIQQSLDHFQSQENLSAQAHLARTLHWQSVVYEAQGSKIMGNAIKAAAKQTWVGVREARGCAVSETGASPATENFDGEVEFWFR